jgi:acetylornithine/succinyldiaminopimelate/putrescine aminotransferase
MITKEQALEALRTKQRKLKQREATLKAQREIRGIGMMGVVTLSKFVEILIPIVESGQEFYIPEEANDTIAIELMAIFAEDVEAVLQGNPPQSQFEEELQKVLHYFVNLKKS